MTSRLLQLQDGVERGGGGQHVAGQRPGEVSERPAVGDDTGRRRFHHRGTSADRAARRPSPHQRLAQRRDIRLHSQDTLRPAQPHAQAGDHLVEYVQRPVLVRDLDRRRVEAVGKWHQAGFTAHRLAEDRRHASLGSLRGQGTVQRVQVVRRHEDGQVEYLAGMPIDTYLPLPGTSMSVRNWSLQPW